MKKRASVQFWELVVLLIVNLRLREILDNVANKSQNERIRIEKRRKVDKIPNQSKSKNRH